SRSFSLSSLSLSRSLPPLLDCSAGVDQVGHWQCPDADVTEGAAVLPHVSAECGESKLQEAKGISSHTHLTHSLHTLHSHTHTLTTHTHTLSSHTHTHPLTTHTHTLTHKHTQLHTR